MEKRTPPKNGANSEVHVRPNTLAIYKPPRSLNIAELIIVSPAL